jgi:polygalacturonase
MTDHISRRTALGLAGSAAFIPLLARPAFAQRRPYGTSPHPLPWVEARRIVATTRLPRFRNVNFDVRRFGAKCDGVTDDTAAFEEAIRACSASGGGHVIVAPGTYVTGAIYLKSNVDLHLRSGATLRFSGDVGEYPIVLTRYEGIECMNHSPMIYAYGERNIALTGSGTLDAGGTSSWNTGSDRAYLEQLIGQGVTDPRKRVVPGSGHSMRSAFIEPYNCRDVLIQGVTLKNPMFWQIHPTLCTNVTVDRVSTDPSTAHSNTDGCNPECSDHVVIKNCTLGAHDDNIAIKSGRDDDGRRVNVPSQNIVISGCVMNGNWGAITCGSEMTGGIRNVYAHNCTVVGATKFALYVKSNTLRGGFAQNINLDGFSGTFDRAFSFVQMDYNHQTGDHPPAFGPFAISRSSCTRAPVVFDVSGLPSDHVNGFRVANCAFDGVTDPADRFDAVDGISFTGVTINGTAVTS